MVLLLVGEEEETSSHCCWSMMCWITSSHSSSSSWSFLLGFWLGGLACGGWSAVMWTVLFLLLFSVHLLWVMYRHTSGHRCVWCSAANCRNRTPRWVHTMGNHPEASAEAARSHTLELQVVRAISEVLWTRSMVGDRPWER